ncbi:MAG: spheroidene monooxygenase [Burkholderiaceae bacterium]|jgi:spheroidene monooxygenase
MSATAIAILVRWQPQHLLWGLMRLPLAVIRPPQRIGSDHGLLFQKFLGSGDEGGFQLKPSLDHQAWFGVFQSKSQADAFISHSPMVQHYQKRSRDCLTLTLQAYQSRGSWSGFSIEATADRPGSGPVVSLTRASIRPGKAADFWRQSPAAETDLERAEGCELAMGLGEMPVFRQATLSLWQQESSLVQYAQTGAHQRAIAAAYGRHFFSESMFTRFRVLQARGQWKGRSYD